MLRIIPVIAMSVFISTAQAAKKDTEEEWVSAKWDQLFAVATPGPGESRSIGSYALRIYRNSRDAFVSGLIGIRNGSIASVWLTDLDKDDKPEIAVWISNAGSGSYGELHVYTLEKGELKRILIKEPAFDTVSGYRGHDVFTVENGQLYRAFPRYHATDDMSQPGGGMQRYRLDFPARRWVRLEQSAR